MDVNLQKLTSQARASRQYWRMSNRRAPRCALEYRRLLGFIKINRSADPLRALAELEDRGLSRAVNGAPREEAANDQIDTASSKRIIV